MWFANNVSRHRVDDLCNEKKESGKFTNVVDEVNITVVYTQDIGESELQ